jgi:amidohydrolase
MSPARRKRSIGDVDAVKERVAARVESLAGQLCDLSRDLHSHPETAFEEHRSSERICAVAARNGLQLDRGVHGLDTAFRGEVGDTASPAVAIVCEYDALPDIGHACGHNIIAAAGLGAALALAPEATPLGGRLRLLGTPAEEGGGGKILMARDGAFDGVSAAMMVHPADADLSEITAIAVAQLRIHYEGRAAHAAAAPEEGVNALDAAVLGYGAVAALRQHIRPDERIHGIFTHGGDRPNVVPHRASMHWFVRSPNDERLEDLKSRVVAALEAGATATGCSCRHSWDDTPYSDMVTDPDLLSLFRRNWEGLGRSLPEPAETGHAVVGSTDMGNISHMVPSIHPMIAVAPRGTAIHTERFAEHAASPAADEAVLLGAKAMAMTAVDLWMAGPA